MGEKEFGEGKLPDTENGNFPNFEHNHFSYNFSYKREDSQSTIHFCTFHFTLKLVRYCSLSGFATIAIFVD